jgi:hypothetical protein
MELSKLKVTTDFVNGLFSMDFNVTEETRNKLYFGKYQYKACIKLLGLSYTYYISSIEKYIERIEKFKNERTFAWRIHGDFNDSEGSYWNSIDFKLIEDFLQFKNAYNNYVTIRIEKDTASIFSNNITVLQSLLDLDHKATFYKASVYETESLFFKKQPKHKFRVYFKSKRVKSEFMETLLDYHKRAKNIKISPALISYLSNHNPLYGNYRILHSSYYIDYNDESMLTIFHMLFPGMLGKVYNLKKHP